MKIPNLVDLTCVTVTELITEYMDNALSSRERVHFEQHLHACTWCMTYLAQMRRTIELSAASSASEPASDRQALLDLYRDWQSKRS